MADRIWHELFEAVLGVKIFQNKANLFEDLLNAPEDDGGCNANVGNTELCQMVMFLGRQKATIPAKLTAEQIAKWLFWFRKNRSAERTGRPMTDKDAFLQSLKQAMLRAPDHFERYAILCDPVSEIGAERDSDLGECKELDYWASRQWPDWTEETENIRDGIAKHVREWVRGAGTFATVPTQQELRRKAYGDPKARAAAGMAGVPF